MISLKRLVPIAVFAILVAVAASPAYSLTKSGDCNGDGSVNIGDFLYLYNYIWNGGPAPDPLCAGDVNGDCSVNTADLVYLYNYIWSGGPAPQCCQDDPQSECYCPGGEPE